MKFWKKKAEGFHSSGASSLPFLVTWAQKGIILCQGQLLGPRRLCTTYPALRRVLTSVVGPFQGSIFVGTQFTSLEIKQKQQV